MKIGDEIGDGAPLRFLFVELCHSFPMAFRIEGLKAFRSDHSDDVLVGKPSDLPFAGKFGGAR
jgi:hypothetical protein